MDSSLGLADQVTTDSWISALSSAMSNRRILAARADYVIRTWVYERVEWLMKKINTLFAIGSEQELKYILPENEVVYGIIRANIGKPSLC